MIVESSICFLDEKDLSDAMLVGGFYLPRSKLEELDEKICEIKLKHNLKLSDEIKYNLLDCEKANYLKKIKPDLWNDIFLLPEILNMTIIMSFVWKGSSDHQVDSWRWAFSNILQRISIDLEKGHGSLSKNKNYPYFELVFDWLPSNKRIMDYLGMYCEAYYNGYSFETNDIKPLRRFKSCPCMVCTSTRVSFALQLNDHLVGLTGDFVRWCMGKKKKGVIEEHFGKIIKCFRKSERGEIVGYGLITPDNVKNKIREKIGEITEVD